MCRAASWATEHAGLVDHRWDGLDRSEGSAGLKSPLKDANMKKATASCERFSKSQTSPSKASHTSPGGELGFFLNLFLAGKAKKSIFERSASFAAVFLNCPASLWKRSETAQSKQGESATKQEKMQNGRRGLGKTERERRQRPQRSDWLRLSASFYFFFHQIKALLCD